MFFIELEIGTVRLLRGQLILSATGWAGSVASYHQSNPFSGPFMFSFVISNVLFLGNRVS